MNKVRNRLITILLGAALASCQGSSSEHAEPVDLSPVRERCTAALSQDVSVLSNFEGVDILQYSTPTGQSDFLIADTVRVSSTELQGAVDRYNSYLTMHNIWSQYELFILGQENDYMMDYVGIMEAIMSFSTDALKDENVKNLIQKSQKELCKEIGSVAFGSQSDDPTQPIQELGEYLSYNSLFVPRTTRARDAAITRQLQWHKAIDTDYYRRVSQTENKDSLAYIFMDAMDHADSFDSQCATALVSVGVVPGEVVLPYLGALLASDRYSPYTFLMWLGWRSAEQYFFIGAARDAQIADEYFNIFRRSAFLATLRYCDSHPADNTARMILELLCSTGNIIRNGSYQFGSDAYPDFQLVFNF